MLKPNESFFLRKDLAPCIIYQKEGLEIKNASGAFKEVHNPSSAMSYFAVSSPGGGKLKVMDYNIEPDLLIVKDLCVGYTSRLLAKDFFTNGI